MIVETEREWTTFSRSMTAVLGGSILLVAAVLSAVAIRGILDSSRTLLSGKAADLARFTARAAFVPVSLEDPALLEERVEAFLDDPDLVYLEVRDALGDSLYSRELRPRPAAPLLIEAEHPVRGPADGDVGSPLGTARVGVSMRRARAEAHRAVVVITVTSLLLLAVALAAGLALISGMTQRLRALLGEARLAQRLQQANDELEAFAYSVSHDLRAPLRHVDGFMRLLEKRAGAALDEQSRRYVTTIVLESKRMSTLIDDLLTFSRTSRAQLRKAPLRLGALASEAIRDLEDEAEGRAVEWKVGALPEVECDAAMMRQVFANLLGNALKFTRKKESAVIEVGAVPGTAGETVIFVRDNGVGFDPAYAAKLFGVFERLHAREDFEGTGIGLAIVKRVIDRHGGRAWAEGAEGKGATFFFSLPRSKEEER